MSYIDVLDNEEVLDLDTHHGARVYVGKFLTDNGASSKVLAAFEKVGIKMNTRIHRAGLVSSPDWGDCENCKAIITVKANYCPGCGRQVER